MSTTREAVDFDTLIAELETLVARLEQGDEGLEQSLHDFERGTELVKRCQRALDAAEQRIQVLRDGDDGPTWTDLDDDRR